MPTIEFTVRPRLLLRLVVAALAIASVQNANADTLYVVVGRNLFRVNSSTLLATTVGPIGFSGIGGLTFDNDNRLFGIREGSPAQLVEIDIATGHGTPVAPVTGVSISASTSLANHPKTNMLYGMSSAGPNPNVLMTISKLNGNPTIIGTMPISVGLNGLSFDLNGNLWGIDAEHEQLVSVNQTNAALTVIGSNGLASYPTLSALDVGPTGVFWSINVGAGYELISIDPASGAPVSHGTISGLGSGSTRATGIAASRVVVPEPASAALIAIGVLSFWRRNQGS